MVRLLVALCLFFCGHGFCQLSGTLQVPGTYTSLASVISTINQQGSSGPLWILVGAGYTETVPSGGLVLNATGTASAPIVFQKLGVGQRPRLYAFAGGNGTPGSSNQDGIWKLNGCDYVTIDGFELIDTNSVYPATMEFGLGFFKNSGLDGCQHNTVKNCRVQLSNGNNASATGIGGDGSRAINMINATASAQTSSLIVYAPSGSNSNNLFYANQFLNCNTGIYLVGFPDIAPYGLADSGNDIGGNVPQTGNQILNFGGGSNGNSAFGIRTAAQYHCKIAYNEINSNTGSITNHMATLKGISIGAASGANVSVLHNTITLHGGGSGSAIMAIENAAGSGGIGNVVKITNNVISSCSYSTAVTAPFYGIYSTSSAAKLLVDSNQFYNNSTESISGATYLLYNNGLATEIFFRHNRLSFSWNNTNTSSGNLYAIYNNAASSTATLSIQNNQFLQFACPKAIASGTWYFIYNTADCSHCLIENNSWKNLHLNHSGNQFFMYNTSSTQALLSVCNNSLTGLKRTASSGHTYGYYAAANSAGTAVQTFSNNIISGLRAATSGTGNFYGIYNAEGNANPYPRKKIYANVIENISINATGSCYGIYCSGAGDANTGSGSEIYGNSIRNIEFDNSMHGMYISGAGSSLYPVAVYDNTIATLSSSATNAGVYGAYLANSNAGIKFFRNRISDLNALGTTGVANGIYGANTSTASIENNLIANLYAPSSNGSNRVNGIYLNAGAFYNLSYNTVMLQASSTGSVFGTNALYASSTLSLLARNNIFVNTSQPSGSGVVAAYRRSTSSLTNYLVGSDRNLFYAGVPSASTVIFYNGSSGYQTLSSFQSAVATRDQASVTQHPNWLSVASISPFFLHIAPSFSTPLESGGSLISTITEDYDQQPRPGNTNYLGTGTAPDIGADEFELNTQTCSTVSAPTILHSTVAVCAGQSATLFANNTSPGAGFSYQWKQSQQSGGPYTTVATSTAASALEYTTGGLSTGTYYFILEATCLSTSQSATSQETFVQAHAIPSLSLSSTSTLVCAGEPLVLTATAVGASHWNWEGPNAFFDTAQNPTLSAISSAAAGTYSVRALSLFCSSSTETIAVSVNQPSITTLVSSPTLCAGGSATLSCMPSTLSYSWSNGAQTATTLVSPLQTTVYSVSATNSLGCTASRTVAVTVIQATIQASGAVVCQTPAVITVTAAAFNLASIHWYTSPTSSISFHTGNSYSLSIFTTTTLYVQAVEPASACQSMRMPVTVNVSSFPSLTLSALPATVCPGKPSVLSAAGATTYSWTLLGAGPSKTIHPLTAGVYTVQASNGGSCITQSTIPVSTFTVPLISVFPVSVSACPLQPVVFGASGAVSYTWSGGTIAPTATVLAPLNTTYTVYGSNLQNCVSSATCAVVTRSLSPMNVEASQDTVCLGETVELVAHGALSYTWVPGGLQTATLQVSPLVNSVYNAIGLSANGCTNVAFSVIYVEPCLSLDELTNDRAFLYPNPVHNHFFVEVPEYNHYQLSIELMDVSARPVIIPNIQYSDDNIQANLEGLPSGCYFVNIKKDQVVVFRQRLIKGPN